MRIDLIWLTADPRQTVSWSLGDICPVQPIPAALAAFCDTVIDNSSADHLLFWDSSLPLPDRETLEKHVAGPGDGWHAGLRLGMAGQPALLDFVTPTWRFNRDPDPQRRATSWRLSFRACLLQASVLRRCGGPSPHFDTLAGAALEAGHRWIQAGAFLEHAPGLLPELPAFPAPEISLADQLTFVRCRHGQMWAYWALFRALRNGSAGRALLAAWRQASVRPLPAAIVAHGAPGRMVLQEVPAASVSVLIPTLDRYPYLFDLLDQLRRQSLPPHEIVVVDQTAPEQRQPDWPCRFPDLPLHVIWQDQPGQCSSRNAGLQQVTGDYILFLDDDDRVPADLIATHLDFVTRGGADASCGVAEEVGAGPLPAAFKRVRPSDVFPTNNTLLRREALQDSGLFDLAYNRGERADGDLGMRLYLAGRRLGLNPAASVVHLHAPHGGLRQHGARAVTRAGSRASLLQRHLLAPTEGYLWSRYFSPRQVREALLIRTISSLRGHGNRLQRLARAALMLLLLTDTYRRNRARLRAGQALLRRHPTIPRLRS